MYVLNHTAYELLASLKVWGELGLAGVQAVDAMVVNGDGEEGGSLGFDAFGAHASPQPNLPSAGTSPRKDLARWRNEGRGPPYFKLPKASASWWLKSWSMTKQPPRDAPVTLPCL